MEDDGASCPASFYPHARGTCCDDKLPIGTIFEAAREGSRSAKAFIRIIC